jgi:two-component system cell cycle response regulator DivK
MTKLRILSVEDNPALAEVMRTFLESEGYEVLEAQDGAAAVQMARQELPDLILMDLQLPVMSGLEAIRRIRHLAELRDIPIVAVTGFATDFDAARAHTAGCNEFVTKPYQLESVLEVIRRLAR